MHPLLRRVPVPLVVALLCGLLLAWPPAHARAATNRVVATPADGPVVQTTCTSILNFCSLREALAAAADGDTLLFNPDVRGTITLDPTQGALPVTHAVTIQGPGAAALAVDGGYNPGAGKQGVPVFGLGLGVHLTVNDLTIQNGFNTATGTTAGGGGISGGAGTVTVTDCVVRGNHALAYGGGILAGDLTLIRSTVSDNTAGGEGGGIALISALTPTGAGSGTLTDSILRDNTGGGGGGLFSIGNTTITTSTIADNTAIGDGGGALLQPNTVGDATLTITKTTLTGNRATGGSGGAIFAQPRPSFTVTGSTITGNTADGAGHGGGGIDQIVVGTVTDLSETIVAGNSATNGATAPDLSGSATSHSYNLIGDGTGATVSGGTGDQIGTAAAPLSASFDPRGLQDNGGPTPTVALLPNSPAIDAGGPCATGTTDQRGLPRVGNCDVGAYEYQPVTPTVRDMTVGVGGGPVTFQGTGFQTGSQLTVGTTTVTATAADVNADGTQLRLPIPAHAAGAVPFTVTNPGSGHSATGTLTYTRPTPLPAPAPTVTGTGSPVALPGPRPAKALPASGNPNPLPTGR